MSMRKRTETYSKADMLANQQTQMVLARFHEIVTNALQSRTALLQKMMDVKTNINQECGYPDVIQKDDYKMMFEREGIARRVVEYLPEECWRVDPYIYENKDDSDQSLFDDAWDDLQEQLNLYAIMARADTMSRVGHFGIMVLGFNDNRNFDEPVIDGMETEDLEEMLGLKKEPEPVKKPKPKEPKETPEPDGETEKETESPPAWESDLELMYVRVLDESLLRVAEFETRQDNPRYGQPNFYMVKFLDPKSMDVDQIATTTQWEEKKVHWHRVIHLADNRTSSEVFGTPAMKPVYNRLVDLRKLLGGSAEMFWKGGFPGISFEMDEAWKDLGIDNEALKEQVQGYMNGLQRYLALEGVVAKTLTPNIADPQYHIKAQFQAIAVTIGIPQRMLLGTEAAQLASSQDQETANARIARRQEKYVTPYLIKPLINRLILFGVLPPVLAYFVEWPDLNLPSEMDKASTAKIVIEALKIYAESGVDTMITPKDILVYFFHFETEEAEALLEAAEELQDEIEAKELQAMEEAAKKLGNGQPPVPGNGQIPQNGQPPVPPANAPFIDATPAPNPAFPKKPIA